MGRPLARSHELGERTRRRTAGAQTRDVERAWCAGNVRTVLARSRPTLRPCGDLPIDGFRRVDDAGRSWTSVVHVNDIVRTREQQHRRLADAEDDVTDAGLLLFFQRIGLELPPKPHPTTF